MPKSVFLVLCNLLFLFAPSGLFPSGKEYYWPDFQHHKTACTLNISKVIVGDCEYIAATSNQSKVIVAVFLAWNMPNPGEMIRVQVNGQIKLFDPFMKGCPPYVQFIFTPDGSIHTVSAEFVSGNCIAPVVDIQLPLPCDPPVCTGNDYIGGKVYSDYNGNGTQESSENGLEGIEVRLYDDAKQLHAVTKTETNGLWAIGNLNPGQKLRIEYQVPLDLFDANPGQDNKTRTQMARVGNCDVDLGIYQLANLIDPNPWMVSTCFAKGNALNRASPAFNEPTLVANLYNTTEGGPRTGPNGNYYLASAGETGSVWGLSFQNSSRKLFSAAFLKRNASLGPGGLGAIYLTDLTGFLPNPPFRAGYRYYGNTNILLNFDVFGISTGNEASLTRNLPLNPLQASHDTAAFDKIGKWGLGDLDCNSAEDTLYVVNLFNRSLISIAIGNPISLPITANRIQEIPIPDPGCIAADDWRPWGLKYHDGVLYVGGVCSAESSNNTDDLKAVVYAYKNGSFTKVVSFDLNYIKGYLNANYCSTFRPWNRNFYTYFIGADVVCGPVPVLSDIEFDSEGNMIISLGDRYGYQTGGRDYGTNTRDGVVYISFAGGDNLKLYHLKGEYLLEQNGTSGFYTTQGVNNNQGVCGGEFYFQDGFYSHQESTLGALAAHPSYNTIVATLMDPANIWSNGWSQLDNSLGSKRVNYNIFTGEYGTFGKAAGLGDIELLIGSSTPKGIGVSIGNFVWSDSDQDGIQDPGEQALPNVNIYLFKNDTLVKQTQTDTSGLYYFLGLDPLSEYIIQLGLDTHYLYGEFLHSNVGYAVTQFQSRINFGNSENDSDASKNLALPASYRNKIALSYLTGKDGENNFSLDFGLFPCNQTIPDTALLDLCASDSVKIGDVWFSATHSKGLVRFPNTNGFGCDSLLSVEARIHQASVFQLDTSVCQSERLFLHNEWFDAGRTQGAILLSGMNQYGCDSLLQVQLNFRSHSASVLDTSICPAGSLVIHHQTFDSSRTSAQIVLTGASKNGCDSVIDVKVNVLPYTESNWMQSICPRDTIILHNEYFHALRRSGDIVLSGANQHGCDSILHVQIVLLQTSSTILDTAICPGGYVMLQQQRFDENRRSGDIILSGANQYGCDSTITVNLSVLPKSRSQLDTSICPGEYLLIHNQRFDELYLTGDIVLAGMNHVGCDSILTIQLKIRPQTNSTIDTSICPGEYILLHQQTFDETKRTGRIVLASANQFACDSVIDVRVSIRPETKSQLDTFLCPKGSVWIHQQLFDEKKQTGEITLPRANQFGCDSIVAISLLYYPDYHHIDSMESCVEYFWPPADQIYRTTGLYSFRTQTVHGCDSNFQLQLRIHPEFKLYDTICVLNKYVWPVNNELYEESGNFLFNHYSEKACDSIEYLHLIVITSGEVYVPNVFSPNGDNINDRVGVFSNPDVALIDVFAIYNRWGELMYERNHFPPNDQRIGWDGIFKGQPAIPAVYVFRVEWRDKFGGKHKAKGDITLIR
ncbi:MAG: gliding motility-associated C-terminal domain-containing protein [Saprospiraceae bacterium]|nr:gliding motility-associated C-terminal domain-containing protein [Saprospiraceae bacterium]